MADVVSSVHKVPSVNESEIILPSVRLYGKFVPVIVIIFPPWGLILVLGVKAEIETETY